MRPLAEALAFGIGAGNAASEGDFRGKQTGQQVEEFVKEVRGAVNGFLPEGFADVPQMPADHAGVRELDGRICHEGNRS